MNAVHPLAPLDPFGPGEFSLCKHLMYLHQKCCALEQITVGGLLALLGYRGTALILFLLSLPFTIPMPIPGLSIPFGVGIAAGGLLLVRQSPPWVPRRFRGHRVPREALLKTLRAGIWLSRRTERLLHPRLPFLLHGPMMHVVNGGIVIMCGALLALPLPPGTNFPPALVVTALALGLLEEDGLAVIGGYLLFLLNIGFFALLYRWGAAGFSYLFNLFS